MLNKEMKIVITVITLLLPFLNAFPQGWESIKYNEDYLYGEGWGSSIAEADRHALADLISKIATTVRSEIDHYIKVTKDSGKLNEKSQFDLSVKTYSQATLTNTRQIILQNEPDAHVVRWMKKSEIEKIFELRKQKALDLVNSAVRAESKGKVDVVLRNYYWALALLKSLQYPNDMRYKDAEGHEHILTNWIKEQMEETFSQLRMTTESREGNDVKVFVTYKGKPVSSVEYTYYDGRSWSAIYSAKDGCGIIELVPGFTGNHVQVKYEYVFMGEAKSDKEVESVLEAVSESSIPKAYTDVMLDPKKKSEKLVQGQMAGTTFTTNEQFALKPPTPMERKETKEYMPLLEKFVSAVKQKDYLSVRSMFTDAGWDMFRKLMEYGKAKVLDSSNIRFYEEEDNVIERGLRMSFSFATGMKRTFVEDIVLVFNNERKIDGISFGLGKTAEDDILNRGAWDEKSRFAIMNFLENYKTAYALKRLDYISSVFDDDAIIITGRVLRKASKDVILENQSSISHEGNYIIKKNRQTKDEYLKNLERCFRKNEFVNIRFSDNEVRKLREGAGESYAIQIHQDYYSSTYGDKGYLMLFVDINDRTKPLIRLRTWQMEKDPDFGRFYDPDDF